ncbi:MAG TPA: hypothetical protein VIH42_11905 [Thermoguttaceae bacterium]
MSVLMLQCRVLLPAVQQATIEKRILTITIMGQAPVIQEVAPDLEYVNFQSPQNGDIILELVDVDREGNRSEPRIIPFKALSRLAPPQPGDMTVEVIE